MTLPAANLDVPQLPFRPEQTREARLATLRDIGRESWIARNEIGFTVLTYEAVQGVLRDKRWHSATGLAARMAGVTDEKFLARRRVSILSAEGDMHVRLRRLVGQAFSPRSADRLRPFMREVMNGLVDPLAAAGRADVALDICDPYPIPVICELLGAPKEDWRLFSRLAEDVLLVFSGNLLEILPRVVAAQEELEEYAKGLIAARRSTPADDLITDLIAAEEAGDRLDIDELVMMVEAVIVGGTDTTRNQLGLAVALFAEHPDQWAMLAEDPSLAPRAVDEVMRYHGAVANTVRFASEDIEFNGVLFPAGTIMSTSMATANFDPAVFPDALRFDIRREPVGQPHLSFGSGIHFCLGSWLARAELQEALLILSRRMPNLRLDGPVVHKPSANAIFGVEHLPVAFDAGH